MHIITFFIISLSIEEPLRDRILLRFRNDLSNKFPGVFFNLTSSFGSINLSYLTDHMSHSSSNTSNGCKSIYNYSLTLNISILESDNVFEVLRIFKDKTLAHLVRFINFNFYLFLLFIASIRSLIHLL
jgi:hypothetical protein